MNWPQIFPQFVLTLWRLTFMAGVMQVKDGYQLISLHIRSPQDRRIGIYFYWFSETDPMFALQFTPFFIAYSFWCASNPAPMEEENDKSAPGPPAYT